MGKGYNNYMTKKFFHPGSKENIKRVWMAQQKADFEKKKQEELSNQYQKEQEMYAHRALLGDQKAKLGLSFMYDAPAGAKKNHEKEDDEPEYKFEWQGKFNAPREAFAKNDDAIRDQPFGIEVKNIRCLKCHKWGHMNTDIICPLFKQSLTAEPPQPKDSEHDLLQDLQEDGLRLKQVVMGRKVDPRALNQQMVDSDEEDDPEAQFLKSLTDKQKKKLLKKIEKIQEKKKKKKKSKKRSESSDDDHKKQTRKHHKKSSDRSGESDRSSPKQHHGKSGRLSRKSTYDSPTSSRKQHERSPRKEYKRRYSSDREDESRRSHNYQSPRKRARRESPPSPRRRR